MFGIMCRSAKPYGRISHLLDWAVSGGLAFPERSSEQAGSQGERLLHKSLLLFSRDAALITDWVESSCLFHLSPFLLCRIEGARIAGIRIMRTQSM